VTGTIEELNEIAKPLGWWFNPEAPAEDVHKLVNILADWVDDLIAEDRQKRIVAVFHKKRRARRGRRSK